MKYTFKDYVDEERKSFKRITTCTVLEKISVFKLSTTSSEEVFMRALARVYLENEKYSKISNPNFKVIPYYEHTKQINTNPENDEDFINEKDQRYNYLEKGREHKSYKSVSRRKLQKLLENAGRLSLDVCRCPLLWSLLMNCEITESGIEDCHLIGQKYVGWSKSFQLKFLDMVKNFDQ